MNIEQLRATLQPFFGEDIGASVYAVLKDDPSPKRLDIEGSALQGVKELFLKSIREDIVEKDGLTVMRLSDSDARGNAIYEYDLPLPDGLLPLQQVTSEDEVQLLELNQFSLSSIKALAIEIGNNVTQILLYKTIASVNVFGRGSFFLRKSRTRLTEVKDEFLRINPGFQLFAIGGTWFVVDLESVEKHFGFSEVIRREAEAGIASIEQMGILANPDSLREMVADLPTARRIIRVARHSPVIRNGIQNEIIVSFCKSFPGLAGRIRFNGDENKLLLDTKVSKQLFLKLLMDDYLTSELTNLHYESLAKDTAEAS